MLPNIDDLIKLGVHNWPSASGRFTGMYGRPGKCTLCEKPMSVYYVDYVGAPVSYYCDNYRCPLSWKFRAYLMGKFDPEDCLWSTFDGDGNAYMFTKATRTHYTGNLEWSNPDCDPGTLM